MVSLHAGRFVVVHLYSTFSVDPQNFFCSDKFILKIAIFRHFCGSRPTFLKSERWNLVWWCGPRTPSTKPNFVKIAWQIYTKNTDFRNFGAVGPHFKTHNGEIWHEGMNQGLPPQAKFCKKKSLNGVYLFRANLYPKLPILAIWGGCKRTV